MTHIPSPDLGPTGPAFLSRPSRVIVVEGKARGSVATERVEARRMGDAILADRMHARGQLSDRQHAAAVRLTALWVAAGLAPHVTAAWNDSRARGASCTDPEAATPFDAYLSVMRAVPAAYAPYLQAMLYDHHPGWNLPILHLGLDHLADTWGLTGDEWAADDETA